MKMKKRLKALCAFMKKQLFYLCHSINLFDSRVHKTISQYFINHPTKRITIFKFDSVILAACETVSLEQMK